MEGRRGGGEEGRRGGGEEERRGGGEEGRRKGGEEGKRGGGEEAVKDYILVNISYASIRTAVACAASSLPMSLKWSRPSNARLKKMLFHM